MLRPHGARRTDGYYFCKRAQNITAAQASQSAPDAA